MYNTESERTEIDNGAIVAPPMYWSVLPGSPYAMRYSTGINSLMHARNARIRRERLKALAAKEVAEKEQQ